MGRRAKARLAGVVSRIWLLMVTRMVIILNYNLEHMLRLAHTLLEGNVLRVNPNGGNLNSQQMYKSTGSEYGTETMMEKD